MRPYPSDIAFTPAVKRIQTAKGSRADYAKVEQNRGWKTQVTPDLAEFVAGRINCAAICGGNPRCP